VLLASWHPVLMLYAAPPLQLPLANSATFDTVLHVMLVAHGHAPQVRPST
jgi:hypothetical protein